MLDSQWQDELTHVLRTLQIIVGALIAGCTAFLVIVLIQAPGAGAGGGQPLVTYIAIAFAVLALVARVVVLGAITARGRRSIVRGTWRLSAIQSGRYANFVDRTGDAGKLAMVHQTGTIVAGAILEGATFFLLAAYMLEPQTLSLVVAIALIFGLATHIPTRSRLIHWIEDQVELLGQERQRGE